MRRAKRNIVIVVLCVLILSSIQLIQSQHNEPHQKTSINNTYILYNSYIDIDVDRSLLNKPLGIGVSHGIPVTIRYSTDIPNNLFAFLPEMLKNRYFFGSCSHPIQTIDLRINQIIDGVEIFFSDPRLFVPIPTGSDVYEAETILYIIPNTEIHAASLSLTITASCSPVGKIRANQYSETISFSFSFNPLIDIDIDTTLFYAPPTTTIDIPITVTNKGNKDMRLSLSLDNPDASWLTIYSPSNHYLAIGSSGSFTFTFTAPHDFSGFKTFNLQCIAEIYPYNPDASRMEYPFSVMAYYQ